MSASVFVLLAHPLAQSGWEKALAITTGGLALVTFALAAAAYWQARSSAKLVQVTERSVLATERSVEAAEAAVDIANRQRAAGLLPVVVDVPPGQTSESERFSFATLGVPDDPLSPFEAEPGEVYLNVEWAEFDHLLSVPVRNLGPGIAVLTTPHPSYFQERGGVHRQGKASRTVIPPGEFARLQFRVSHTDRLTAFYVEVAYTDVGGEQMHRTQLFIRRRADTEPRLPVGLAIFAGHAEEPTVAYGEGFD
ncbi:MAG: hypothetical protein WD249_07495 [Gaiellaceae bacterium]